MNDKKFYDKRREAKDSSGMDDITYWDYMRKANQTKEVIDGIPTAKLLKIYMKDVANPKEIKAVVVDGRMVASVSRHYKLVQHKEAFEPIFKGLHNAGSDYDFALFQTDTKAFLKVFVDEIGDNGNGIKLGFEAMNSIDGRNAISYSMTSTKLERKTTTVVEVIGLRLACKNGMKVRVPLGEAEEIRVDIRKETRERITELLRLATNIAHVGSDIQKKVEAVQYVVEAMTLLKEPISQIIQMAKDREVGEEEAKKLIAKYIGKRLSSRIQDQFRAEPQSMWGLYNAITFVASHGVKIPTMNGLIDKSADLLEQEIALQHRGH